MPDDNKNNPTQNPTGLSDPAAPAGNTPQADTATPSQPVNPTIDENISQNPWDTTLATDSTNAQPTIPTLNQIQNTAFPIDQTQNLSEDTAPMLDTPPSTNGSGKLGKPRMSRNKKIAAFLGVAFLVAAIPVGVYLVNQNADVREKAAEPQPAAWSQCTVQRACEPVITDLPKCSSGQMATYIRKVVGDDDSGGLGTGNCGNHTGTCNNKVVIDFGSTQAISAVWWRMHDHEEAAMYKAYISSDPNSGYTEVGSGEVHTSSEPCDNACSGNIDGNHPPGDQGCPDTPPEPPSCDCDQASCTDTKCVNWKDRANYPCALSFDEHSATFGAQDARYLILEFTARDSDRPNQHVHVYDAAIVKCGNQFSCASWTDIWIEGTNGNCTPYQSYADGLNVCKTTSRNVKVHNIKSGAQQVKYKQVDAATECKNVDFSSVAIENRTAEKAFTVSTGLGAKKVCAEFYKDSATAKCGGIIDLVAGTPPPPTPPPPVTGCPACDFNGDGVFTEPPDGAGLTQCISNPKSAGCNRDPNGDGKLDAGDLSWCPLNCSQATPPPGTAQCIEIRAYKVTGDINNYASWTRLYKDGLAKLQPGSKVYFTVRGREVGSDAQTSAVDRARFRINTTTWTPTQLKKPKVPKQDPLWLVEFYNSANGYTIPAGTTEFKVEAQVHYMGNNKWY